MQKLLLIDGNHIMHRAYHAFPPLTTPDNQPIQAVYGFFSMLIKVMEEIKPTHIIVCFDRAAPTFRKQLYAGYQQHRPKMADDLSGQFILLHEALEKIGLPVYELDGYEADDIIGTLAFQAVNFQKTQNTRIVRKSEDQKSEKSDSSELLHVRPSESSEFSGIIETIILSGDRDLLQLVNGHVKVLAPITGVTKFILFDENAVRDKFGINSSQVADYKALVGDNSDGYPGVTGIGPKTAVGLLNEYSTVENLYKNIGVLPEKIGKKLTIDAEQAMLCKKLATIETNAPVHLNLDKADLKNFTQEKVIDAFDWFGFNTIKKRTRVFPHEEAVKVIKKKVIDRNKNQLELI